MITQVASQKEASTAAAAAAEEQRVALQTELNQARQRVQAAEKARLELEVGYKYLTAHACGSNTGGIPLRLTVRASGALSSLVPTRSRSQNTLRLDWSRLYHYVLS